MRFGLPVPHRQGRPAANCRAAAPQAHLVHAPPGRVRGGKRAQGGGLGLGGAQVGQHLLRARPPAADVKQGLLWGAWPAPAAPGSQLPRPPLQGPCRAHRAGWARVAVALLVVEGQKSLEGPGSVARAVAPDILHQATGLVLEHGAQLLQAGGGVGHEGGQNGAGIWLHWLCGRDRAVSSSPAEHQKPGRAPGAGNLGGWASESGVTLEL